MLGQRPHVLSNVAPHAAILRHSSAGKRRGRHLLSGVSRLRFVAVRAFLATWGPYAVGYAFAVFAAEILPQVSRPLWKRYGRDADTEKDHTEKDHPLYDPTVGTAVGLVERPLYVAAFLAGAPAFVGVWLGLKVAGGWKGWQDPYTLKSGKMVAGRTVFNFMLIGSAVSVAYGWAGARIIRALQAHDVQSAVVVAVALFLANLAFYLWLKSQAPAQPKD